MKQQRQPRLDPDTRKIQILESAVHIAIDKGYQNITYKLIADYLNVQNSFIFYYFKTIKILKNKVIKEAIRKEIYPIIAQAIVANDPLIKNISNQLRQKSIKSLK